MERSKPYLLILIFLIASALFSFSFAASQTQYQGFTLVNESSRRYLDEAPGQDRLTLAADRTHRRDPFDNFKYYNGGWDINGHYGASLAFSAAPLVITAAVWFIVFGICLICMCFRRCCCCRKEHHSYSRAFYAVTFVFLVFLTLIAVGGSIYIYMGHGTFQNSIVDVTSYVLKQADTVITNLMEVINYLMTAKKLSLGDMKLPPEILDKIDGMEGQINTLTGSLRQVTSKNADDIRHFIDPLRITLISVTTAMLVLVFLGLLFSVLGVSCLVYTLAIIGWFAVVVTFLVSGTFLVVYNGMSDTCVAMDEWLQNPNAPSALERAIPKADARTADAVFQGTKGVTYGLVNMTNTVIASVYNADFPPQIPLYANRSGPPVPLLCNPLNPDLTDRQCVNGEVEYKDADKVWKNFVCQVSNSGICITQGRMTPDNYNDIMPPLNISFGLNKYSPFMIDLVDSTYVKETFSSIKNNNCPSLKKSSRWMYLGFTILSAAVMCSLFLWVLFGRLRRHRKATKNIMASPQGRKFSIMRNV